MRRLPAGFVLQNMVSADCYRVLSVLGAGGFGVAYAAVQIDQDGDDADDPVCVKLTFDASTWHGEAYLAGLLARERNVVRQLDAFPVEIPGATGKELAFATVMELVDSGTVRDACEDGRLPWPEDRVVRKVRGLLDPLDLLHSMGVSHRDVTPPNVFVANRAVLKLGDFGIAKASLRKSGVRADVANWGFAPADLGTYWRTADDVYQVGLLMCTLLAGEEIDNSIKKVNVNQLTVRNGLLRDAIKAAISVKSRRPQTAGELRQLLR